MCFAMAQAGYKKDSEVRRKRNFLLFLVTYIYSLFYTHLLDMHVCKKMVLSIKFGLFLWATQYPIHLFLSLKSMYQICPCHMVIHNSMLSVCALLIQNINELLQIYLFYIMNRKIYILRYTIPNVYIFTVYLVIKFQISRNFFTQYRETYATKFLETLYF